MVRIKRGTTARKRRKNILQHTKGFRWGRKSKYKLAKDALLHGWSYSFRDRKNKKRNFRRLWQIKINAICRQNNMSYSQFMNGLKKKNIELDRKILSQLAENNPKIFSELVEKIK